MEVESLVLGYGAVTYRNAEEGKPATSKATGSLTLTTGPVEGVPEHFQVSFRVKYKIASGEMLISNDFYLLTTLTETPHTTPYIEVEHEAAKQLAPMLRLLADEIERQVAASEAQPEPDSEG